MYKFAFLLVILMLRVLPSFISEHLTLDDAYDMYHLSDQIVILLLSLYIFWGFTWKNPYIKALSVIILIVGLAFTINYMLVDEEVTRGIELISE